MELEMRKENNGWYWILSDTDQGDCESFIERGPFKSDTDAGRDFRLSIEQLLP